MFEKIYKKIIQQQNRIGLSNIDDYKKFLYFIKNQKIKTYKIQKQKLIKYYQNIYLINDENLILETKLIEVPQNFILNIINSLKSFTLTIFKEQIKQYFLNSKYRNNIKNKKFNNIIIMYFNFSNDKEIDQFNYRLLGQLKQNDLIKYRNMFKQNVGSSNGAINILDQENDLLLINKESKNIFNILYHQLSHYLQLHFGILKTISTNILKNKNPKLLNYFQISFEDLQYYFNQKQFLPHIKDLLFGLENMFKIYNKNKIDFLYQLNILPTKQNIKNDKFFITYQMINQDISPLVMYCCSYILKHKFQKINSLIYKNFNV